MYYHLLFKESISLTFILNNTCTHIDFFRFDYYNKHIEKIQCEIIKLRGDYFGLQSYGKC